MSHLIRVTLDLELYEVISLWEHAVRSPDSVLLFLSFSLVVCAEGVRGSVWCSHVEDTRSPGPQNSCKCYQNTVAREQTADKGQWYLVYRKLDIRLLISHVCFLLRMEMEIVSSRWILRTAPGMDCVLCCSGEEHTLWQDDLFRS